MSAVLAEYRAAVASFFRSLRHPRHQAFALALVVVLAGGVAFYTVTEGWSVADSLYFTVVALTTIGFGDFTPTTTATRLFTVGYAVVGVAIIGTFVNLMIINARGAVKDEQSGSSSPPD